MQDLESKSLGHMGGCQNYGPFLDPCDNAAPNIQGTQKGTIILTTTNMPSDYFRKVECHRGGLARPKELEKA